MRNNRAQNGFTLVELLVYVAVTALISLVLVNVVSVVNKMYARMTISSEVETSAVTILEKLSRDCKGAQGYMSYSTSSIELVKSIDDSGNFKIVRYFVRDGVMYVDDGSVKSITTPHVYISKSSFYASSTGKSEFEKINFSIDAFTQGATTTENFSSTCVLRGTY